MTSEKTYPTTMSNHRHADTLRQADQIESQVGREGDLFDAARDLASLANGIGSSIRQRINEGIEPDAQDLAVLVHLESIAREIAGKVTASPDTLIGVDPLEVTRKHLHLAVYRWIPRD